MTLKKRRVAGRTVYRRATTPPRALTPERRLPALDDWSGSWVAVKDGEVVAAAHSSRDLVRALAEQGPAAQGAIAQFVTPPTDDVVIGVG